MKIFSSSFSIKTSAGALPDPLPVIEMTLAADLTSLEVTAVNVPQITAAHTIQLEIVDAPNPPPLDADNVTDTITLRVTNAGRAQFRDAVGGLRLGLDAILSDVTLTLRGKGPDGLWHLDNPFLTITLCWDVVGEADRDIALADGGQLAVGTTAEFPVCTQLIIVSPPKLFLGLPDLFADLRIEPFHLSTGWIPFDLLEDWRDNLDMRGLGKWLLGLWQVDLSGYDLDFPDWDIDFPSLPRLPYDVQFQDGDLSLRKDGDFWRLTCFLKGLEVSVGGFDLSYEDFELSLRYDSTGKYLVKAGLAQLQYPRPDKPDETDEIGFALPFDLLEAKAACWLFRIGLHVVGGAGADLRVCVDTVLEIGGITVSSGLSSDALWEGDLRLHMRDLTIMTVDYSTPLPKFFATAEPVIVGGQDFFAAHQHEMPTMSFGEQLPRTAPDVVNESGLTVLGFDWQGPERMYVAWEQRGNQLFKALAHDLLGKEAAGAIPSNAETLRVGVEVALKGDGGSRTSQIRVDWIEVDKATASTLPPVTAPTATVAADKCVAAADALTGLHLPFGSDGVDLDQLVVPDPISLRIPGLRVDVAQPTSHALVLRSEEDDSKTVSYLLVWNEGDAPKVPVALASARIGFSFADDEAERQVAETQQESADAPFLTAAIGQSTDAGQALRVFGVRYADGRLGSPKFLKVFAPSGGGALLSLIPPTPASIGVDDCPPPPRPLPPHVPLGFDDFASPEVLDANSPWRLSLRLGAQKALLDLFGGSNNDAVDFTIDKFCLADDGVLEIHTELSIALVDAFQLSGKVVFGFDLDDMSLSVRDGAGLSLDFPILQGPPPAWTKSIELMGGADSYEYVDDVPELFGLQVKALRKKIEPSDGAAPPITMPILQASMRDGKFTLRVPKDTELLLRFEDVGDDGLNFEVKEFVLGPGGVDCVAEMKATTFKMPGLNNPLSLDSAKLVIAGSVLQTIRVDGSTKMPDLFNNAAVSVGFSIAQDPNTRRIRLQHFTCALVGDGPIISAGVRLKFDLTKVQLVYEDNDPAQSPSLQFKVSGKLTFIPSGGELGGTLLENFKDMTLEFNDAPVSDEFFNHVQLMVTLAEPVERELFKIFRIQLRSVGFHPNYDFGKGHKSPALIFGGQIEFADVGDVASVEIDFHQIYLGFPADGESLPAVEAKGLRVEISTGGFKIGGRVDTLDDDLITGFQGEGVVQIPGLPELRAAFAFTRIRKNPGDPWQRAWFIAIEGAKISYQVAPLPLYLRQIGLGFGYRYTSPLIKTFEEEDDLGTLIAKMLEAIRTHQTLANIESWVPDPNELGRSPKWTIGFETVFSMASANTDPFTYRKKQEEKLKSAVAQIVAFLRSDLTFIAAAKVWFPVSADDFFENKKGMRQRPLASGFMAYSAPKSRLLIHAASGKNPYLGDDNDPVPAQLKPVFNKVHFEATFLSEPSLLHAELGWPDRLLFPLDYGALKLECRGGVLFRLDRDVLIQGIYFSATAKLSFSGGLNAGCIGVCVTADARFTAAVRLMAALYLSRPLTSNIYAALGIDISVRFSLRAWLHIKFRFFTLRLSVSFSFELQIIVALELGWAGGTDFGFKAQARVVVGVFGRSLSVRVAASLFGRNVDSARDRLAPYMSSFLEAGSIPPIPGLETPVERSFAPRVGAPRTTLDAMESVIPPPPSTPLNALRLDSTSPQPAPQTSGANPSDSFLAPTLAPNTLGANTTLDTAIDPLAETVTAKRLFNIALREGTSKRRWYGWIMPNVLQGGFFPVPRAFGNDAFARYATLTLPQLDPGTVVYALDASGNWAAANGPTLDLFIRPGPVVQADEDGKAPQDESKLTMDLRDFLAASHVPQDPSNDDKLPFDFDDFTGPEPQIFCPSPPLFDASDAVTDTRLIDPASGAQNPKRQLDPTNRYDRLVLAAMEETPPDGFWKDRPANVQDVHSMIDQALGNQSFLMTTFMEDLSAIATRDVVQVGEPVQGLPADRPTLADLGLLICVEADECPDWLCTRPSGSASHATVDRPTIAFPEDAFHPTLHPRHGTLLAYDTPSPLWPAIDFVQADFKTQSPQFANLVRYFDDDSLNIGWDFTWQGTAPSADLPGGAIHDPEDMLDHYDIAVLVTGFSGPIKRVKAVPGDLLASEKNANDQTVQHRVKSRYQFNVMLADLPELRDVSFARRATVFVNITPIAQTGRVGDTKVVQVEYVASSAPLPADNAALDLSFDAGGRLGGALTWRVLNPPTGQGIAPAARWELVLRPIKNLPLGSYPVDAVETGESGLQSLGGGGLRDGDIVIALDLDEAPDVVRLSPNEVDNTDRDPALEGIWFDLNSVPADLHAYFDRKSIFDHRGQRIHVAPRLEPQPYLVAQAFEFFSKTPPSAGGMGWRMFLRAHAEPLARDAERLPETGYSSLSQVTLKLLRPDRNTAESLGRDTETPTRLLEHLEWIERDINPVTLPADALSEEHGAIRRPAFRVPRNDNPQAHVPWEEPGAPSTRLGYFDDGSNERGVTLSWKAVLDEWPYAASSAFELYETRLDHLLVQDIKSDDEDPFPDFNPHWSLIRTVSPIDHVAMGVAETSFSKPQTWWMRRVAETAALTWHAQRQDALFDYAKGNGEYLLACDDERYPVVSHDSDETVSTHWWSDTESELAWPSLLSAEEDVLLRLTEAQLAEGQATTPMETMRRVAKLPPAEVTPADHASFLAACRDLGEYLVGRRLNPYLNLLVGQLAFLGAPPLQNGLGEAANDLVRYEVDARATLAGELPERGTAPLDWLSQMSAGTDPSGWKILSGLGLGITVSLRDGVTRDTLSQETLREALAKAITQLHDRLKIAKVGQTTLSAIADLCDQHLTIVSPIHANFAASARASDRRLGDVALSMLQVLLSPHPVKPPKNRRTAYEVVAVRKDFDPDVDRPVELAHPIEFLWPDRGNERRQFDAGSAPQMRELAQPGEVVIVRYLWPDAWEDNHTPDYLMNRFDGVSDQCRTPYLRARATLPVAFTLPLEPAIYTPFEQFAPDRSLGLHAPGMVFADGPFAGALSHLSALLEPTDETAAKAYNDALVEALQSPGEVNRFYAAFERFYASGLSVDLDLRMRDPRTEDAGDDPIVLQRPSIEPFHPLRVELAAPEQSEPLNLSPDSQGWLSTTHLVREDWATLRGYAIRALPRSWPLNPESQKAQKIQLHRETGRIDVQFDRIRRIEPPKPLAIRLVGAPDYQMHEIALSEPIERSLSRAGLPLARKLDFLDFRYAPKRRFRYDDWVELLRYDPFEVRPLTYSLDGRQNDLSQDDRNLPLLPSDDTELLVDAPYARFGSTVIRFTAEPFYYDQSAEMLVRAGVKESPRVTVGLLPAKPTPLMPLPAEPGKPQTVEVDRRVAVAWDGLTDLPPLLAEMQRRWQTANPLVLGIPQEDKEMIAALSAPAADTYVIRQPRLLESLPPQARKAQFAAELQPDGYGFVPDPEAFLELSESAAGTRQSVAMIRPAPQNQDRFELTQSSSSHKILDLQVTVPQGGWTEGVQLHTTVLSSPQATPLDLRGFRGDVFNVPSKIVDPENRAPVPTDLQLGGTLVNWVPFFTRISATEPGGQFLGDLPGKRWAVRPVIPRTGDAAPLEADTAHALHVILSQHHRHALNLAALSAPATLEDMTTDDERRLESIYDAEFVCVTPMIAGDTSGVATLFNTFADAYQLFVHLPDGSAGMPDPIWAEVTTDLSAGDIAGGTTGTAPDDARLIVVVPSLGALSDDALNGLYETLAALETAYPGAYPHTGLSGSLDENFAELFRLRRRTDALAKDIGAALRPALLSVSAHHGNQPPVDWPIAKIDEAYTAEAGTPPVPADKEDAVQ